MNNLKNTYLQEEQSQDAICHHPIEKIKVNWYSFGYHTFPVYKCECGERLALEEEISES